MFADPHVVELVHRLFHDFGLVGKDARLEVASVGPFHADARASEVCAAEIDRAAVEDQHLEVDTGTEYPL